MKKGKQTAFAQFRLGGPTNHGGEYSLGKRKRQRPISIKKSMHVVMKSSRAKGKYSLRTIQNKSKVEELLKRYGRLFNIKIYIKNSLFSMSSFIAKSSSETKKRYL